MSTPSTGYGSDGYRPGFGLGAILFVATLLFYFISVSPFVDLTAAANIDPAADKSNTLNQAVFLGLTLSLWLYAWFSPIRAEIAQPRLLLAIIFAWFLAVSILSAYPDLAAKRVVLAFLTCVNAGIMLILPRSERQFARLIAFCSLATLGFAYYGVVFRPELAIHQFAEPREPMNAGLWRGHFPHKNAASVAMVFLSFFGIYAFRSGLRLTGSAILVLAVVFLANAGGKTATIALPATLLATWLFERARLLRVPLVCGGLLAINLLTLGSATSEPVSKFVASLGIDPTFTNRTDIWRIGAKAALDNPLTGYGFQLFWQTDDMVYRAGSSQENWAYAAFNGHNAFLDSVVTTGFLGLALTLIFVLVLPLRDTAGFEQESQGRALTTLYLNIWLYGLFTACFESIFFGSGALVWFGMLMAMFGLRLQRRAVLVGQPDGSAEPARQPGALDGIAEALRGWGTARRARHRASCAQGRHSR